MRGGAAFPQLVLPLLPLERRCFYIVCVFVFAWQPVNPTPIPYALIFGLALPSHRDYPQTHLLRTSEPLNALINRLTHPGPAAGSEIFKRADL